MGSLDLKRLFDTSYYKDPANRWSLSRLILTPLAIRLFVIGLGWAAVVVFAFSQLTDLIDGYVARRTPGRSDDVKKFGEEFDTLCDKASNAMALIFALYYTITQDRYLLTGLLLVITAHEILNLSLTFRCKRNGIEPHVIYPGKVSMACKMVCLSLVMAGLVAGWWWLFATAAIAGIASLPPGVVASAAYWRQGNRQNLATSM